MATLTTVENFDRFYEKRKADNEYGWQADWRYGIRKRMFEELLRRPSFPAGRDLLELGCGNGVMALWFAERGFTVHGFDISPAAVAWAQENAGQAGVSADFRVGSLLNPAEPFAGRTFDFIFDGDATQYLADGDWPGFYQDIFTMLKPGGLFWLAVDLPNEGFRGEYCDAHWHYRAGDRIATFDNHEYRVCASRERITDEVTHAGFAIEEALEFSLHDFAECPPEEKESLLPFRSSRALALSLIRPQLNP